MGSLYQQNSKPLTRLNVFVAATAMFLITPSIFAVSLADSGGTSTVADCVPLLCSDPSILDDSCQILYIRRQLEIPFGSKTRHFKWEVEYVFGTPEHCLKGIDGQFPGPTIRAKAGDTISFEVTNGLHTGGLIIDWLGITELGTASVSQFTINPGETFHYELKVNKAGSYYFHVHFGMQRSARLYGSLIGASPSRARSYFYHGQFGMQRLARLYGSLMVDVGAKPFIRQSRKLLNDEDKELGESEASVGGSVSKPSPSEEDTQDEDKELGENKASVSGSASEPAPSE